MKHRTLYSLMLLMTVIIVSGQNNPTSMPNGARVTNAQEVSTPPNPKVQIIDPVTKVVKDYIDGKSLGVQIDEIMDSIGSVGLQTVLTNDNETDSTAIFKDQNGNYLVVGGESSSSAGLSIYNTQNGLVNSGRIYDSNGALHINAGSSNGMRVGGGPGKLTLSGDTLGVDITGGGGLVSVQGNSQGVEIQGQGGVLNIYGGAQGVDISAGQRLNIQPSGSRLQISGYDNDDDHSSGGTGISNGIVRLSDDGVFLEANSKNVWLGRNVMTGTDLSQQLNTEAVIVNSGGGLVGLTDYKARLDSLGETLTPLHYVQKKYVDDKVNEIPVSTLQQVLDNSRINMGVDNIFGIINNGNFILQSNKIGENGGTATIQMLTNTLPGSEPGIGFMHQGVTINGNQEGGVVANHNRKLFLSGTNVGFVGNQNSDMDESSDIEMALYGVNTLEIGVKGIDHSSALNGTRTVGKLKWSQPLNKVYFEDLRPEGERAGIELVDSLYREEDLTNMSLTPKQYVDEVVGSIPTPTLDNVLKAGDTSNERIFLSKLKNEGFPPQQLWTRAIELNPDVDNAEWPVVISQTGQYVGDTQSMSIGNSGVKVEVDTQSTTAYFPTTGTGTSEVVAYQSYVDNKIDEIQVPTLQSVTDEGEETTNSIVLDNSYLLFKNINSTKPGYDSGNMAGMWYGGFESEVGEVNEYTTFGFNFRRAGSNETTHTFDFNDNQHQTYFFPQADEVNRVAYESYVDNGIESSKIWDWDAVNGRMTVKGSSGVGATGQAMFAVGNGAGLNNIGYGLLALGYNTAQNNTKNYVLALGTQAAQNNTGGNGVFIGYQTGQNNAGTDIVAIGSEAAKGAPTGSSNSVIIGRATYSTPTITGNSAWQGGNSVYLGYNAAKNIQSTYQDVYIGESAGSNVGIPATGANQYSGQNVAIGLAAFRDGRGVGNILIGGKTVSNTPFGAGRNLVGNDNIVLGGRSGYGTGNNNFIAGHFMANPLNGNNNINILGSRTLNASNTVLLGTGMSSSYNPVTGDVVIGNLGLISGNSVDKKVGIGLENTASIIASPRERLDIGTDGFLAGKGIKFDNSTFQVTVDATTLTANRSQKLPDKDGTFAMLSDIVIPPSSQNLQSVLTEGNESENIELVIKESEEGNNGSTTLKPTGVVDVKFGNSNFYLSAEETALVGVSTGYNISYGISNLVFGNNGTLEDTDFTISDQTLTPSGLKYEDNYFTNPLYFTDRNIPDVGYVNAQIANIPPPPIPTLQGVTDEGNITTAGIVLDGVTETELIKFRASEHGNTTIGGFRVFDGGEAMGFYLTPYLSDWTMGLSAYGLEFSTGTNRLQYTNEGIRPSLSGLDLQTFQEGKSGEIALLSDIQEAIDDIVIPSDEFTTEKFTYTSSTTFTLSNLPKAVVAVYVNRTPIFGIDNEYEVSSSTVDVSGFTLNSGDIIRITYKY